MSKGSSKVKRGKSERSNESKREGKAVTIKISKEVLLVGVAVVFLAIGFALGYVSNSNKSAIKSIKLDEAKAIAKSTLEKFFYDYYSSYGLQLDSSSLKVEISDVKDYNPYLYEVDFSINGKSSPQPLYLSKDGKYAVKEFNLPKAEMPKSERPNVSINVMSFCPYGNQAENALVDVINLLGDKVDFVPHYIIYKGGNPIGGVNIDGDTYWSLHGDAELREDVREKIIYKMYGAKTWANYVVKVNKQCNLNNVDSCWKNIAEDMGLDVNKIEQRYNESFNSIVLSEYKETAAKGISGSPTILINGQTYRGSRSSEAFKDAICNAFLNPPVECNENLSQQEKQVTGSCG